MIATYRIWFAAPYLGYGSDQDETYLATRKTLLSSENPYFYEGKYAKGNPEALIHQKTMCGRSRWQWKA